MRCFFYRYFKQKELVSKTNKKDEIENSDEEKYGEITVLILQRVCVYVSMCVYNIC